MMEALALSPVLVTAAALLSLTGQSPATLVLLGLGLGRRKRKQDAGAGAG